MVQAKLRQFDAAADSLTRAVSLDPEDTKAWYNRGKALMRLQQYGDAIASFDAMIARQPESHRAWYNRALALAHQRRYTDALSSLDTAVTLKPDCDYAWTYRGLMLNKLRRFEEAHASFGRSLRFKTPNPQALYGQAVTYGLQGKAEQAAQSLQAAMAGDSRLHQRLLQGDPNFSHLMDTPAFQALLKTAHAMEIATGDPLDWQQYSSLDDGPDAPADL